MFSSKFRKRSQKSQAGYEPEEVPEKRNAKPEAVSTPTIFELGVSKRQECHATIVVRVPTTVCLVASGFDVRDFILFRAQGRLWINHSLGST